MRILLIVSLIVVALTVAVSSAQAQVLPPVSVDSSFRLEYLFGHQSVSYTHPDRQGVGIEQDPRLFLLSGILEGTPAPFASIRLAGSISVIEQSGSTIRTPFDGRAEQKWDATPDYSLWEVGGLYHLWNDGGYRFSLTAGYRQENWKYTGDPMGPGTGSLRDEFSSNIPFLGLQTSMLFPWWKARFELIGSPFMSRRVIGSQTSSQSAYSVDGTLNRGGLVEAQIEGSIGVSPGLFVGVNVAYSHEELYGDSRVVVSTSTPVQYNLYSLQNWFKIGFDINIVW